jgi:hypothetical protein
LIDFLTCDAERAVAGAPLETLLQMQRKLAAVSAAVGDGVRRASSAAERGALRVALLLTVRAPVRVQARTKLFRLAFDVASGELSVAEASARDAAAAQSKLPSDNMHTSMFVESERSVAAHFCFGAQPILALLYHRLGLKSEAIHYRFLALADADVDADVDIDIDRLCARLQRRDERGALLFEWCAVRRFEDSGVRQTQYAPETLAGVPLAPVPSAAADASDPAASGCTSAYVRAFEALLQRQQQRQQQEAQADVVDERGSAFVARNVVLRCLQLEPQLRVWDVLEQDIDACFALAPTRVAVSHSPFAKRAGLVYS